MSEALSGVVSIGEKRKTNELERNYMREPIENVTKLQKQLNDLQLENKILKKLLEQAGVPYKEALISVFTDEQIEPYDG